MTARRPGPVNLGGIDKRKVGRDGAAGAPGVAVATVGETINGSREMAAHMANLDPHPQYASDADLAAAVAALVDSSPAALNTLNELAAALGDDPNFATTMVNALAGKAALVHTHVKADITDLPALASGTYTPTVTGVTNCDGVTASVARYQRMGSIVFVSGRIDVDPTAAATLTRAAISLPVASNLSASTDVSGSGVVNATNFPGALVNGDAANDRADLYFTSPGTTSVTLLYQFAYTVI